MTTTRTRPPPQRLPDFYDTPEQCIAAAKNMTDPSNPRYSNFKQTHFTAGDEEQFQAYRDATNGNVCIPEIDISGNLFADQPFPTWDKYRDVGAEAVIGTFRYIFNKFKKGIFVKIQDNKLVVFLPFSKANFTNEWHEQIHIDPKYKGLDDFLRAFSGSYRFNSGKVNHNVSEWYANNCIVRYDVDYRTRKPNEGDTNVGTVKNMLENLCKLRKVPDIEFFMNRRDFPLLTRDGTEPYDGIWGDKPLVSYNLPKYIPILSMCNTKRYADLLVPTHEDWARVQSLKNIWFPRSCREYTEVFDIPWKDKKRTAVFRGASTGCGVTIQTNPRLKLAYIGANYNKDEEKGEDEPLLDVGITKWNLRPRKVKDSKYLQSIDVAHMNKEGIKLVNFLSMKEQSQYRYIINVDGHVSAFRLSIELGMGSVILLVESKWKMWYTDMLIPYEHYVPVNSDLSNLIKQIEWCRDNDAKCQEIANNSKKFFETYLQEKGILDYLQKTIVDMKSEMGVYLYNEHTPLDTQLRKEMNAISLSYPTTQKSYVDIHEIPRFARRTFGLLQGVHWAINLALHERKLSSVLLPESKIFTNKLGTVDKYTLGNAEAASRFPLAIKTTSDPGKIREHIHEVFVGTKAINPLLKHIPNFAYTFGLNKSPDEEVSVINEFIPGLTFADYLKDQTFVFNDCMSILMQICLAIQVAQNRCGLVHYDLAPWNIILQPSKNTVIDYVISYDNIIRVKTNVIPVIIDYGKAHVFVDQEHHGFINMFRVSTIQDVLSILLYTMNSIIRYQKLDKKDFSALMKLTGFIVGTKYRPEKFSGSRDLKNFLQNAVKYSSLCTEPKYELEDRNPMDLFKWLLRIGTGYKYSFVKYFTRTKVFRNVMDKGNGRQIFEYILSNTTEERAQTYFKVFERLKHCTIPQPQNLFFVYYAIQAFTTNLDTVNEEMNIFLSQTSDQRPRSNSKPGEPMAQKDYEKAYEDSVSYLARVYEPKIKAMKEEDVNYDIKGKFSTLETAPYTAETFLSPNKIERLLKSMTPMSDISQYQEIIISILINTGKYRLEDDIREHYIQNFSKLLGTDALYMKNNCANLVTLRELAKSIYSEDLKVLSSKLPGVGNCTSAKNYINEYNLVLKTLE